MTDESKGMQINPIAHIHTGFSSKFGIPRQSGLVGGICGEIIFEKEYRSPDWTRGLEGYSHIWVLWLFSENVNQRPGATVRPPKLGGNKRMGVFATRSPFRPNFIGMSVLKLEKIQYTAEQGTVLYVKGADMLDGTPIIDIKPYLPFSDSIAEAIGGFAGENSENMPGKILEVRADPEILKNFPQNHTDELLGILSQDPRPAYIEDAERIYSFEFYGKNIKFTVENNTLDIIGITSV